MRRSLLIVCLGVLATLSVCAIALVAQAQALSFAPRVDYSTGSGPGSVALGDFDRDGILDVVTADGPDVSVLLGLGGGSFAAAAVYPTSACGSVAVGDLDKDGELDLVVGGSAVGVLLGRGDGTFAATTDYPAAGAVALADFNGDGNKDVVTADYNANTVGVLLGKGDGTLGAKVDYATGSQPVSVAVGDFNRDGKKDLAVANADDAYSRVSVLLGQGDGTFAARSDYGTGAFTSPSCISVADLNRDGKMDLAVACRATEDSVPGDWVSVLLGKGDGTFALHKDEGVGGQPSSVAVGDLNGDAWPDLVAARSAADSVAFSLGGGGNGVFYPDYIYPATADNPSSVAVGDLDGDGRPDLVSSCINQHNIV